MPIVAVVRPGCTDFDEQNRIQGVLDLPLNERGRDQLAETIVLLAPWPLEAIYTAGLDPAHATALALGEQLDLPVHVIDELQNVDHGLWQGLSLKEVGRKSPRVLRQWQESPETVRPPEGETVSEAMSRLLGVLRKPMKREESFAVVASEPLATLVGCAITAARPEFESVAGCRCQADLLEVYSTTGEVPAADPDQPWRTRSAAGCLLVASGNNGGPPSG